MSLGISAEWEELRELPFGSIDNIFMGVGTGLSNPARIVLIQNLTDVLLVFSYNGITPNFKLPKRSFILLDLTGNKTSSEGLFQKEGDRLYVKHDGVAPTEGSVCFSAIHANGD